MKFPIDILSVGDFTAELRREGFDARTDVFNGQVGVIVGPLGLDEKRLPEDTLGLFFPLWEINLNRPLVEQRRFHDIFEGRPDDWQLNKPYANQPDRTGLAHWNRSASFLGNRTLEEIVQKELIRLYPPNRVPVNIDVLGGQGQMFATVFVTNSTLGIDEQERAMPEVGKGMTETILEVTRNLVADLRNAGKLPKSEGLRSYTGLDLTLKPIGRVGSGPDVTKWTEVYQYVVENLPSGEQAWIANFGAPYRGNWKILRATDNVQTDWSGDYPSVEAALASLKDELSNG